MKVSYHKLLTVIIIGATILVSGCSTVSGRYYSPSTRNILAIQNQTDKLDVKVKLNEFTVTEGGIGSMLCRGGPIIVNPTPESSILEFIHKAFRSELKQAGIYADNADVVISGNIDKVSYHSGSPITDAHWDITITLSSNKSEGYQVVSRYDFLAGHYFATACRNVANTFAPAVQDLLKAVITHPNFKTLLGS
jgi:hypothetical protein